MKPVVRYANERIAAIRSSQRPKPLTQEPRPSFLERITTPAQYAELEAWRIQYEAARAAMEAIPTIQAQAKRLGVNEWTLRHWMGRKRT